MIPSDPVATYFDELSLERDERIAASPSVRYEQEKRHQFVRAAFGAAGARRVLDVGCGNGRDTIPLALEAPGVQFNGVDLSSGMISMARAQLTRHPELEKRVAFVERDFARDDMRRLRSEEQYDLIICSEVLEHVEKVDAFVRNLASSLSPHGYLVLTVPNWWSLYGANRHLVEFRNRRRDRPPWPHPHDDWQSPLKLERLLAAQGLRVTLRRGICYLPGFSLFALLSVPRQQTLVELARWVEPAASRVLPFFGYMYGIVARHRS